MKQCLFRSFKKALNLFLGAFQHQPQKATHCFKGDAKFKIFRLFEQDIKIRIIRPFEPVSDVISTNKNSENWTQGNWELTQNLKKFQSR